MSETGTMESPAAEVKTSRKAKKVKEPKGPRKSLKNLLWSLFSSNSKPETIIRRVAEEFPTSEFNQPSKTSFHIRYYLAKYNGEAKKNSTPVSGTVLPKVERAPRPARKAKTDVQADA